MSVEGRRSWDRNCGPRAVARITGWPVDRVVMHIRAVRERTSKLTARSLSGGTFPSEHADALRAAGWTVEAEKVRVRLRDLGKDAPLAWWLCYQPRHVFAWQRRTDLKRHSYAKDVKVWAQRVRRTTTTTTGEVTP